LSRSIYNNLAIYKLKNILYDIYVEKYLQQIMHDLEQLMTDFGLNEKEVKVFLAMFRLGQSTASLLAKETDITRTNIYDMVESLKKKGLVVEFEQRGVRHFEAIDHAGIIALLSKKERDVKLLQKSFVQMADAFHSLRSGERVKTSVRFFEGQEGMQSVYEEIRSNIGGYKGEVELLTIWPVERLEKVYPSFFESGAYLNLPNMKKRDILFDCESAQRYIDQYSKGSTHYRFKRWPKEKGEFAVDTLVWLNKVAFTDVTDLPSGIIIENPSLAITVRMWFEQMWEGLD